MRRQACAILGVAENASEEEVKAAYKALVKIYHPDTGNGNAEYYNNIVQAYDYLTKQNVKIKFRGYEAIVVQHELDHLEGILYFDHINKKKPFEELEGATLL